MPKYRITRYRPPQLAHTLILLMIVMAMPLSASALSASAVSVADTLDSRPPVIAIGYPAGGEVFVGSVAETLQWTIDEQSWDGAATPVTLRVLDGLVPIDEQTVLPDPGGVYEFIWTVPELTTTGARLVVLAADRFGWAADDSSGIFSLLESSTAAPVLLVDRLGPVIPNPFNPSTRIHFSLKADTEISLSVFDMRGREISRLAEGEWPAGGHDVQWQGRDGNGAPVASGAYFARLHIHGSESVVDDMVTRLTLVR